MDQFYKQKKRFRNIISIINNRDQLLTFLQKDCNYLIVSKKDFLINNGNYNDLFFLNKKHIYILKKKKK